MLIDHTSSRLATGDPVIAMAVVLVPLLVVLLLSLRRHPGAALMDKPATDAIRGLAALGIIVHHVFFWVGDAPDAVPLLSMTGQMGVAVFLALSGYGLERAWTDPYDPPSPDGWVDRWLAPAALAATVVLFAARYVFGALYWAGLLLLAALPVLLRRTSRAALGAWLARRLTRVFVPVALAGAVAYAGALVSGAEALAPATVVDYLTGANLWFVKVLLACYAAFALSRLVSSRRRIPLLAAWAVAVSVLAASTGQEYPASFGLAFPAGVIVAAVLPRSRPGEPAVPSRSGGAALAVLGAGLASLAMTLAVVAALALWPELAGVARDFLLAGLGVEAGQAAFLGPVWSTVVRMVPSVIVACAALGLAWVAWRARLRSPLLAHVGRLSLPLYVLNSVLVKSDPVLHLGPLALMVLPAMLLLVAAAWALQALGAQLESRLGWAGSARRVS